MSGEPQPIKRRRIEHSVRRAEFLLPPEPQNYIYKPSTSINQSIFKNEYVFDDVCLKISEFLLKHMNISPDQQQFLEVDLD